MEYEELECVGGSLDGEYVTVKAGQDVLHLSDGEVYRRAEYTSLDVPKADHPLAQLHVPILVAAPQPEDGE